MQNLKHNILAIIIILFSSSLLIAQQVESKVDQDFKKWDTDGDGYINNGEFQSGLDNQGYFNTYDSNTDGRVDDAEWRTAEQTYDYLESDNFAVWDTDKDGTLNNQELGTGVYNHWDTDRNGRIERLEYETNYSDWGTE